VERIDFETVKKDISQIFASACLDNWDLIPDSIHHLAATQGIDLNWKNIANWTDFEEGRIDFEEADFLEFAFYSYKPEGLVYLVTNNCFKSRDAYSIDSRDLLDFVKTIDELEGEVTFVQPMDYVFINPERKLVTLIHHEGQVTQYKRRFNNLSQKL
jgi:hypothetical protein